MSSIPFKDRLVVRLALGMIRVAIFSLLLMFLLQYISISLSDLQSSDMDTVIQRIIETNPNDKELFALVETPLKIRRVIIKAGLLNLIISGALWIIFAVYFARSIATPIEHVTLASAQITNGDLATRVQIPKNARGEPAQLLEHFNKMATSLEAYEQERTEMIASIAHELRTPLAVMRSRLEVMEEGLVELNLSEVTKLGRQVDLLTRLVNDLRTLSLADTNLLSLNLQPLQLHEIIQNISDSLQIRAIENQVKLELELNPILLNADSDRISQVVFNLLDNALKHTPEGGLIKIELKQIKNQAQILVKDSGSGFEGDAQQLFKRFYTTKSNIGSSGIGLALVKTIVELHTGRVNATNSKTGGAVFEVYLPIKKLRI